MYEIEVSENCDMVDICTALCAMGFYFKCAYDKSRDSWIITLTGDFK